MVIVHIVLLNVHSRRYAVSKRLGFAIALVLILTLNTPFTACRKDLEKSALQITNVTPRSAQAGAMVTIKGNGFSPDAAKNFVKFNKQDAVVLLSSPHELIAIVPKRVGVGPVTITVKEQTAFGPIFNLVLVSQKLE